MMDTGGKPRRSQTTAQIVDSSSPGGPTPPTPPPLNSVVISKSLDSGTLKGAHRPSGGGSSRAPQKATPMAPKAPFPAPLSTQSLVVPPSFSGAVTPQTISGPPTPSGDGGLSLPIGIPFGPTPNSGARAARLSSQLREKFDAVKRIAQQIKKMQLCDVTHRMLDEWSTQIAQLIGESDELVATLPTKIADMEIGLSQGHRRTTLTHATLPLKHSKDPGATPLSGSMIIAHPHPPHLPLDVASPTTNHAPHMIHHHHSVGQLVPGAMVGTMLPDTGRMSQVLSVTTDVAQEKMKNLAMSLHVTLDAATKALNAEKASIAMPIRGSREDLRSVCSVGFEKNQENHNRLSVTSPEMLCMKSGLMIVCSSGTNPPVELDIRSALAFFQKEATNATPTDGPLDLEREGTAGALSLEDTLSATTSRTQSIKSLKPIPSEAVRMVRNAANKGNVAQQDDDARASTNTLVTSLKSKYWSKIVCPIRLNNSTAPMGVVTFLNKDKGHSNFSTDDETLSYGVSLTLAGILARCGDIELLVRLYERQLPVPSFPPHLLAALTVPGSRNQLVYRTKDPGGREIKILTAEGKAERLDAHTPLTAVAEYIQRMQQSWRDAVLLNTELRKTHEERTRVVTSLLVRARTQEFKNLILETDRVNMIPDDDTHNAEYFRDYGQFKKSKKRLDEMSREEALARAEEARRELDLKHANRELDLGDDPGVSGSKRRYVDSESDDEAYLVGSKPSSGRVSPTVAGVEKTVSLAVTEREGTLRPTDSRAEESLAVEVTMDELHDEQQASTLPSPFNSTASNSLATTKRSQSEMIVDTAATTAQPPPSTGTSERTAEGPDLTPTSKASFGAKDRRETMKAKELLFGKEKLPPPIVDP